MVTMAPSFGPSGGEVAVFCVMTMVMTFFENERGVVLCCFFALRLKFLLSREFTIAVNRDFFIMQWELLGPDLS